jgi:hypothetical protein
MKHPGLWYLCAAWALFAGTELWLASTSKADYMPYTGGMALFFTALFVGLGLFARRGRLPLDLTKLPSPQYWLDREHRQELDALVADLFYTFAAGAVLWVALINASLFNGSDWSGYAVVLPLVVVLIVPVVRFTRGLARIPGGGEVDRSTENHNDQR